MYWYFPVPLADNEWVNTPFLEFFGVCLIFLMLTATPPKHTLKFISNLNRDYLADPESTEVPTELQHHP